MLTENVTWANLNKAKLNNGYTCLLPSTNNLPTTPSGAPSIMDYESSSDAALLAQEQLDVSQQHSNIIANPVSPHHVGDNISGTAVVVAASTTATTANAIGSSNNSSNPTIHTSPTNKSQSVVVVQNPNSMQTITTLQRNNVKNSSTRSIRSNNSNGPIGNNNNIKPSDNTNIFKANNNSRKYKFNLFKLSSSPSSRTGRGTRNRLLLVAVCLIVFGIAVGALSIHLSGIYHCNLDRIGM